ncbi:Clp protease ClpB [Melghirimyces algeriensis]|uniref:Phage minor structural protein GP20 n=1 Tax=Melghirimyces algeriensis TaxID=910412 RepID=A0A521FA37_9BACL|nr:Clp protease ClpB [Melghirimyces algeriensis]SMO92997.1 hypothetical protein SAMN06264849_11514 [Melghirimyces algeriensis]
MKKKKRSLKMNLQFFAEETKETDTEPSTEPSQKQTQDKMIPYERFKEVNDSLKSFKETFKKLGLEDVEELKGIVSNYKKLQDERKKAEREKMSEIDRLKVERDEALTGKENFEKQLAEVKERIREQAIQSEFIKVAMANNIDYIDDALKLADFSNVEYNEDGGVKGVEEVVKYLAKNKPFLLKQQEVKEPKQIGSPSNPAPNRDARTLQAQLEEAKKEKNLSRVIELSNKLKGLLKS